MEIAPWPAGTGFIDRGLTTSPPTRLDGTRSAAACRCSAGVRETKQALGRREADLSTKLRKKNKLKQLQVFCRGELSG